MLTISGLYIYPVKSLSGIAVNQALVTDRGFEYDRRWMLIDGNNRFLSQRELPEMCLFGTAITDNGVLITHKIHSRSILIPFKPLAQQFIHVTVWDDTCLAQLVSPEADGWFSETLGLPCRLVYMPDESERQVDRKYAPEGSITSFADGYPFMTISQETLDDLNKKLPAAIPMDRFRPSLVFTGGKAYAEDELASFSINNIQFYGVKLCARCNIPTIDQQTAISYREPTKTLAAYRRKANNIYLGQNLIHTGNGLIKTDDIINLQKTQKPALFNYR